MGEPKSDGSQFGSGGRHLLTEEVEPQILQTVTAFIDRIPDLLVHVHKILKIVSDIESDAKEITRLAASDPVMVSQILKAVNSAYFSLAHKIDDLHLAIVLLGYREIRKMAIQCGFSHTLRAGFDTRDLWEHSYLVSVCAESIISLSDRDRAGVIVSVGILHDIGKFVLQNPVLIARLRRLKRQENPLEEERPFVEAEDRMYGINHTIVGGLLAERWNLSDKIKVTLKSHHLPSFVGVDDLPFEHRWEIGIVCAADLMVNRIYQAPCTPEPSEEWFKTAGIEYPLEKNLTKELRGTLEKAKNFLLYID